MLILCGERESATKGLVLNSIQFFIKVLKLTNSKFTLLVFFQRGMAKETDNRGYVQKIGPKCVQMVLDSSLGYEKLIITIAHEMVHVKQYAKGQLTGKGKTRYWMGKKVRKDYYDQPWELEAFSKERILANKIFQIVNSK